MTKERLNSKTKARNEEEKEEAKPPLPSYCIDVTDVSDNQLVLSVFYLLSNTKDRSP